MKLNGSQIIIESLIEQGVDTVFGYPGDASSMFMMNYTRTQTELHIFLQHTNRLQHTQLTVMLVQQERSVSAWQHLAQEQQTL